MILALPRPLFDRVPMPNTKKPFAEVAPASGTVGNWKKEPDFFYARKTRYRSSVVA
jgi:hypothetical protein